jgi:hypothetical protein
MLTVDTGPEGTHFGHWGTPGCFLSALATFWVSSAPGGAECVPSDPVSIRTYVERGYRVRGHALWLLGRSWRASIARQLTQADCRLYSPARDKICMAMGGPSRRRRAPKRVRGIAVRARDEWGQGVEMLREKTHLISGALSPFSTCGPASQNYDSRIETNCLMESTRLDASFHDPSTLAPRAGSALRYSRPKFNGMSF